jgi:hypothetical protein
MFVGYLKSKRENKKENKKIIFLGGNKVRRSILLFFIFINASYYSKSMLTLINGPVNYGVVCWSYAGVLFMGCCIVYGSTLIY